MKRITLFFLIVFLMSLLDIFCFAKETVKNDTTYNIKTSILNNTERKDPKLIEISEIKPIDKKSYSQKVASDNKEYNECKKIMSEDYYNLYIVFEKILRANNLYYQNWRLAIKAEAEDVNAYAGSANMIVIYSSLYDSLYNNKDALAFVLSHELSHFILGHHQISLENTYKIKKMEAQVANMKSEANTQNSLANMNNIYGNQYAAMGNSFSSLAYSISAASYQSAINKIYAQERELELDADSEAISLMARAGFDVDRGKDALEFLSNLPNIYTNRSTHPPTTERISNIKHTIQITDTDELQDEGMQNIYNSKVLKAKKSSDNETIVISKPDENSKVKYKQENKEDKLIKKAYKNYLDNEMSAAKSNFEDAYKLNSTNYIPALYLSYINEYEYKQNNDKKSLKQADLWIKKAYKLKPNDKNILKQKQDINLELKK